MSQVGVRELKNQLSRYLKRVQEGEEIIVTEHGRSIVRLLPVMVSDLKTDLEPLLGEGVVRWSGGKPRGLNRRPVIKGHSLSEMVVEGRR
jgi:prevent-host-death family protein